MNTNLILTRTDSESLTSYNNRCYVIMSPYKMREKIKLIENDLKIKLRNINK